MEETLHLLVASIRSLSLLSTSHIKLPLQHVVIFLFLLMFASCFMMGKAQKMDCVLKKVRILVYDLKMLVYFWIQIIYIV